MRARLLILSLLACAAVGCAGRQQPEGLSQDELDVYHPIELVGPACPDGGPQVEIVRAVEHGCGKGDTCTRLDQRIRNPTDRALWLLVDGADKFSPRIGSASLLRAYPETSGPVWEIVGAYFHLAFRVPPGGDVVVRNLDFSRPLQRFRPIFLDRIALADGRDIGALAADGLVPARGEIDVEGVGGFIDRYESRHVLRFERRQPIAIKVRCVLDLPVPYPGRTAQPR